MAAVNRGMIVGAVDYSMSSPAIAVCTAGSLEVLNFHEHFIFHSLCSYRLANQKNIFFTMHQKFESDIRRFDYISEWAIEALQGVDQVLMEGYSMGSKGLVYNIGENTGLLKHKLLFKLGKEPVIIPPTVIKKSATGKGNADKSQMHKAFVERTGVDLRQMIQPKRLLGSPTTDIVDAFFIAHLADRKS